MQARKKECGSLARRGGFDCGRRSGSLRRQRLRDNLVAILVPTTPDIKSTRVAFAQRASVVGVVKCAGEAKIRGLADQIECQRKGEYGE